MDLQRLLLHVILWMTPVALVVVGIASTEVQCRVLPVFVLLILLLDVGVVYRYWPRRDKNGEERQN